MLPSSLLIAGEEERERKEGERKGKRVAAFDVVKGLAHQEGEEKGERGKGREHRRRGGPDQLARSRSFSAKLGRGKKRGGSRSPSNRLLTLKEKGGKKKKRRERGVGSSDTLRGALFVLNRRRKEGPDIDYVHQFSFREGKEGEKKEGGEGEQYQVRVYRNGPLVETRHRRQAGEKILQR